MVKAQLALDTWTDLALVQLVSLSDSLFIFLSVLANRENWSCMEILDSSFLVSLILFLRLISYSLMLQVQYSNSLTKGDTIREQMDKKLPQRSKYIVLAFFLFNYSGKNIMIKTGCRVVVRKIENYILLCTLFIK
jgi:hypothetical protein